MAKKKAAKKAAKAAAAPKARPAPKKASKPKAAAKQKAKPASKTAPAKRSPAKRAPAKRAPPKMASPPPLSNDRRQAQDYAAAVEAFQAGKIKKALQQFEIVADGPDAGLRHRAHVHINICRQRSESDTVELSTADDYYNYAVKLINDRRLSEADEHLDKALKKAARAGHVHYAKAVVAALRKNSDDAVRSLSKAIDLDPKHRLLARRDPDLAAVRSDARIAELIQGNASAGDS